MGSVRLPRTFSTGAKESIADLKFRLRPFAVMAGRIVHDDGEPAIGNRVEAFREYRNHLRHGYLLAASASTNDRGEYRMFGLQPESYIVAAVNDGPQPLNEQVRDAPRTTTTFYLSATKLSEVAPVILEYGQEVGGIDIFLERVRKVRVHGHVTSGLYQLIVDRCDARDRNISTSRCEVTCCTDGYSASAFCADRQGK
jgi:hypothetical protein